MNGNFIQRLINTGPGDPLDSPWGLAIAPAGFGTFANDLLVGNFGNGEINAFNPTTGAFLGTLDDSNGNPIVLPGLRDLTVGNGGAGVDPNAIYFTAGLPNFDIPPSFLVPLTGKVASFIWDTEDGTLAAWTSGLTPADNAVLAVNNSNVPNATLGAVYKGLAIGVNVNGLSVNGMTDFVLLFATNFRAGTVEAYAPASSIADLFVTYAKQNAQKHDDGAGECNGFVDCLTPMAICCGGANSSSDTLYFTAGPNNETNGLFGTITPQ